MSVIVNQFSVNTGEKIHLSGDVISGLSKAEEKALVDAGHCRYPDVVAESTPDAEKKDDLPEGLTNHGSGNYELSDGTKVRGKDKAIDAQLKLNSEAQKPDGDAGDESDPGSGPLTELPE